jgi:hypothetical protein
MIRVCPVRLLERLRRSSLALDLLKTSSASVTAAYGQLLDAVAGQIVAKANAAL